jgi:hypothetical protein
MTKTRSAYISGFARGITEAISDNAFHGPSSMTARLLNKDALKEDLADELGTAEDNFEIIPSEDTLSDHLAKFGWSREHTWNLNRRLGFVIGKPSQLLLVEASEDVLDGYSGFGKGNGPFYFTEDLFIAVYKDVALLFIVGNDE